jgi:hypothetical protein
MEAGRETMDCPERPAAKMQALTALTVWSSMETECPKSLCFMEAAGALPT